MDEKKYQETADEEQGGALRGILGALIGALVGSIPWFLVSTFADYFVAVLGALTGVAACYGYHLFKGRGSKTFALVVVILSSVIALFVAEFGSWMYLLCADPEWQADAASIGVSVARLAWESLMMPDNWSVMAPSMLLGMGIGVLGVISVGKNLLD